MICQHCYQPICAEQQMISCDGFCLDLYHTKCLGMTTEDVICCNRNAQIWWMCRSCCTMMNDVRMRETMQTERSKLDYQPDSEPVQPKPTAVEIVEEIADVKQQLASIRDCMTGLMHSRENSLDQSPPPIARSSPLSSAKLLQGSRCDATDAEFSANIINREKFWLFFTRIKNTVSEEQMLEVVSNSLGSESRSSTVIKKLVPCWKDVTAMPYVSFKVGIDPGLKNTALLPSTWPMGICFREFQNHVRVWEPHRQEG